MQLHEVIETTLLTTSIISAAIQFRKDLTEIFAGLRSFAARVRTVGFVLAALALSSIVSVRPASAQAPTLSTEQAPCFSNIGAEPELFGAEGSSAPLWVKSGANVTCLAPDIRLALPTIIDVWSRMGAPTPVVTSGTDGSHMVGSRHFQGEAVDLRLNELAPMRGHALCEALRQALNDRFPNQYDTVFEPHADHPEWRHCHVEFDRHHIA
jgi:hypothetical protein